MQGTEMWLAVLWLLVDYLSESEALGYRPRRPQSVPAASWPCGTIAVER
jgi:hypothetical protein